MLSGAVSHQRATWNPPLPYRLAQCRLSLEADIRTEVLHVCFVPCVDGSWLASQNFTSRRWSVQPCVRPVSAVRMTAGHNALRGSGPGQKPAFCDALAHVGCPDRRIDRLCITCLFALPTFTSRQMPSAISFTPQGRRVPCSALPLPSWPKPFWRSCWRVRWRRPWSASAPARP